VTGEHAYLGGYFDGGMQVIDVSNPAVPTFVRTYETYGIPSQLVATDDYLYVADNSDLEIVNIKDPRNPRWLASHFTFSDARGITIASNYAYVAALAAGLLVFDVSDPAFPELVGWYDTRAHALSVALSGMYALVADREAGLHIIDVSNPARPRRVGTYEPNGDVQKVVVAGNHAYVIVENRMEVIEISDAASPEHVGSYVTRNSPLDLAVVGANAYLAGGDAGLLVIDISDPTNPRLVGQNPNFAAFTVQVTEDYAFIGGNPTLTILDLYRPPPLRLESVGIDQGIFRMRLSSEPGQRVQIKRSHNLKDWQDHGAPITLDRAPVTVSDPDAGANPRRFYRAVVE
jgi:hypothetical protein